MGSSGTNTSVKIPEELSALYSATARRMMDSQSMNPLAGASQYYQDWMNQGSQNNSADGVAADTGGAPPNKMRKLPGGNQNPDVAGEDNGAGQPGTDAPPGDWTASDAWQQRKGTAGSGPFSGGSSTYMPGFNNGPMDGGDYGFLGPNARQVAGASGLMDRGVGMMGDAAATARGNYAGAQGYTENAATLAGAANAGTDTLPWQRAVQGGGDAAWQAKHFLTAGPNQNQREASVNAEKVARTGQKGVDPQTLENNALVQAKKAEWERTAIPTLQNSFSSMGLGRSGAQGAALSDSWAKNAMPVMEQETMRAERGIDREMGGYQTAGAMQQGVANAENQRHLGALGAMNQAAGTNANLYNSFVNNTLGAGRLYNDAANTSAGIGSQDFGNQMAAAEGIYGMGQDYRGISNEMNDSVYDDFLRRQGLAENALYTPFGSISQTMGTSTSGGK